MSRNAEIQLQLYARLALHLYRIERLDNALALAEAQASPGDIARRARDEISQIRKTFSLDLLWAAETLTKAGNGERINPLTGDVD